MREFIKVAFAVAAMAITGWSCDKDPKPNPQLEADNSYFVGETETSIVWAGVQTNEGVHTIYLATAVPASAVAPITIEGLMITMPEAMLGTENNIGSGGITASLNGMNLTGGKIEATLSDTQLTLDIKDSKIDENDFIANWEGVFVVVTEPVVIPENYYIFDGERVELAAAYNNGRDTGDGYDGHFITFADKVLSDANDLFDKIIDIYLPVARMGQDIALVAEETIDDWEFSFMAFEGEQFLAYYGGAGDDVGDIAGGYFNGTVTGNNVTFEGNIEFVDGKTMEIHYTGEILEYPEEEKPELEYDETLNNQWQYDGGAKVGITYAHFELTSGSDWNGMSLSLSNEVPEYDEVEDAYYYNNIVFAYSPIAKLGTDIPLVYSDDPDYWIVTFWDETGADYEGYGDETYGMISDGKMILTQEGNNVSLKMVALFYDNTILQANYSGSAIALIGAMKAAPYNPSQAINKVNVVKKNRTIHRHSVKTTNRRTDRRWVLK